MKRDRKTQAVPGRSKGSLSKDASKIHRHLGQKKVVIPDLAPVSADTLETSCLQYGQTSVSMEAIFSPDCQFVRGDFKGANFMETNFSTAELLSPIKY